MEGRQALLSLPHTAMIRTLRSQTLFYHNSSHVSENRNCINSGFLVIKADTLDANFLSLNLTNSLSSLVNLGKLLNLSVSHRLHL